MNLIDPAREKRKPGPRGITRHLTINGVPWRVFEYVEAPDCPNKVSLMFSSDAAWRRVRIFPRDWATRDDASLFALTGPAVG